MVSGQPHHPADGAPPVSVGVTSAVATITMRTPALTAVAKEGLLDAVVAAADDGSVRAIVLTGTGRVFCAGQDLAEHAAALRDDPATAFATRGAHAGVRHRQTGPRRGAGAAAGGCPGCGAGGPAAARADRGPPRRGRSLPQQAARPVFRGR